MKTTTVKRQRFEWTTELNDYISELRDPDSTKRHTWSAIADKIQEIFNMTISPTAIRQHYISKLTHKETDQSSPNTELNTTKSSRRRKWTSELDSFILNEVQQKLKQSKCSWKDISQKIEESFSVFITQKSVREHYYNKLDPTLIRTKITPEESLQIQKWVDDEGHHWAEFGRRLSRSENDVKNHYYSLTKKLKRESHKQNLEAAQNTTRDLQYELKISDFSNLNVSILEENAEQYPLNSFNVDDYLSDYALNNI